MKRLAIVAAVTAMMISSASADFSDALRAYDGGDYETAYTEWRLLAEQGDAESQAALAGMYLAGAGMARDYAKAAAWYRRAAEQGQPTAQLNLGDLYSTGRGVKRDLVQAYLWLSLAAAQDRQWAAQRLQTIAAEMSAEQVAEAQGLFRTWRVTDD